MKGEKLASINSKKGEKPGREERRCQWDRPVAASGPSGHTFCNLQGNQRETDEDTEAQRGWGSPRSHSQ